MALPTQQTADYHPGATVTAEPERVRIALIGGSGTPHSEGLYQLLRRRLLAAATIGLCFNGLFVPLSVWFWWRLWVAGNIGREPDLVRVLLFANAKLALALVVLVGAVWRLWQRPPKSVTGLRAIELLMTGILVALQLTEVVQDLNYGILTRLPDGPQETRTALFASFAYPTTLAWFVMVVVYGAIIPNTLRRCLTVTGGLALCPLAVFLVHAVWLNPLPWKVAADFVIVFSLYLGIAVAVAVFSSSRIERYRRLSNEARKLGQYILKEKLGTGGMGEVYRAEHVLLRRPCAIKLIRPERAGDPKNLLRFEREVQVTATLTHPNTIQIYDYGRADDGTFYYVMEYLPGSNLEQLVRQHGPLPPERAVHLLRQLCGALREAHAARLIHRDIKPSNVIICKRGGMNDVAKLLDFGIVDAPYSDAGDAVTAPGQLLGTPAYMSVEQAAGASDLDGRSDLSSLGATAYFMLTGKPPFDHPTINQTIAAQLRDPIVPPHCIKTGVPQDLSEVIVRCMEKDPARRYQSAAELDRALAACKCAGVWTGEQAAEATQAPPPGSEVPLSTQELERRWGI